VAVAVAAVEDQVVDSRLIVTKICNNKKYGKQTTGEKL